MTTARLREVWHAWWDAHNTLACAGIALGVAILLVGLFLFAAFGDFGASADFIYNQF